MKLPVVLVLVVSALALAACGGSRQTRTIELPGGVPDQAQQERPSTWLDRMFGNDNRRNVGPCPLMGVLYDSARIVQFADPTQERYSNIEFTGEFQDVRGFCRYLSDDPITMSMEIDMAFGRGPASTSERRTYRYWVAVTRRGRAPIERQFFDVDVRFPSGQAVVQRTERIERIVIPRAAADTSGENFEILVGFELTPEQLQFNRDGKRFRIDAGADPSAE